MERRLGRLEMVWQADRQAISECSYSIEWALKWPSPDPAERAARIVGAHDLDADDMTRAVAMALTRCGVPRAEAEQIAELGAERVLTLAYDAAGDTVAIRVDG